MDDITTYKILIIFTFHFLGDFPAQIDWMALNKSKRNLPLLAHILVYGFFLSMIGLNFPMWILSNMVLHFLTDYVTSRLSSFLWKCDERHAFFVVIGLDQLIHTFCLMLTAQHYGML